MKNENWINVRADKFKTMLHLVPYANENFIKDSMKVSQLEGAVWTLVHFLFERPQRKESEQHIFTHFSLLRHLWNEKTSAIVRAYS